MKKTLHILIFLLPILSFSQTWQWAKQGGSSDNMGLSDMYIEQAKSIATDKNNNIYVISPIGFSQTKVAGIPKKTYNNNLGNADFVIAKFNCSGDYKWSRVIGGNESDHMNRVFTDSLGNVYASGMVFRNSSTNLVHFGGEGLTENDTILPFGSGTQNKRGLFLVKYDSIGTMKWLRMPQPSNISTSDSFGGSASFDLSVDAVGNSYWLCAITPGIYAEGAFVNTLAGTNFFIFKYDSLGAFQTAVPLQMYATGYSTYAFKMTRDHSSGNIYVAGTVDQSTDQLLLGGQAVTHRMYVAAFNSSGVFLWKKENANTLNHQGMKDICLDSQGNIYVTGGTGIPDSFNGNPLSNNAGHSFPFLIKLNPAGETIWQTNATTTSLCFGGAVAINGDEVAVTGGYGGMQWDGQSLAILPNAGYDVFLARFNKNTGAILGLHTIPNNFGGEEFGTAIAADASGNYLVGGRFSSFMYVGNSTIQNVGQQSDFFIAKFGSANCATLSVEENNTQTKVFAYPNPTSGIVNLNNFKGKYVVFNFYGSEIKSGEITSENSFIDITEFSSGIYLLQLFDFEGNSKVVKVVRK